MHTRYSFIVLHHCDIMSPVPWNDIMLNHITLTLSPSLGKVVIYLVKFVEKTESFGGSSVERCQGRIDETIEF